MKFSIYLCLLPFTLSAPSSPYTLSIPSVAYVPQNIFIPPQLPYNPTFVVTRHGMFIWKILVDETHHISGQHSEEYFKTYLANKWSINWPVKIELVNFALSKWNLINIELDTSETYILLKVNPNNECFGFYWMGKESGLVKRQLTARLVVRMMYDLEQQIKTAKFVHLSREEENKESREFQDLFNKRNSQQLPKLYRVAGEEGQLIMEAPLNYNVLNSTDAFVFDMINFIFIWSGYSTKILRQKALALGKYIRRTEKQGIYVILNSAHFGDTFKRNFRTFKKKFLKALDGTPSPLKFPELPSLTTGEQLRLEREEQLRLYEYSIINNCVISKEISTRPLALAHLQINKAYIMTDSYSGNIFMYIGKCVPNAAIEQAMAAAEIIYWDVPKYRWQKVTVIRYTNYWPTYFLVNFLEIRNVLKRYMEYD